MIVEHVFDDKSDLRAVPPRQMLDQPKVDAAEPALRVAEAAGAKGALRLHGRAHVPCFRNTARHQQMSGIARCRSRVVVELIGASRFHMSPAQPERHLRRRPPYELAFDALLAGAVSVRRIARVRGGRESALHAYEPDQVVE